MVVSASTAAEPGRRPAEVNMRRNTALSRDTTPNPIARPSSKLFQPLC
uniref:Uncharacterized protein n=1 Tax=Arundo donax TaxID=35708 RepID=A0A0A9EAN5_ARUDO